MPDIYILLAAVQKFRHLITATLANICPDWLTEVIFPLKLYFFRQNCEKHGTRTVSVLRKFPRMEHEKI